MTNGLVLSLITGGLIPWYWLVRIFFLPKPGASYGGPNVPESHVTKRNETDVIGKGNSQEECTKDDTETRTVKYDKRRFDLPIRVCPLPCHLICCKKRKGEKQV
ncbi:hypothetical protein Csa_000524 [Cucumis sativus]|uniref:Uncharacterized protein n=1 Tax=Cucumis sativus TaxID=3659 RepID=A0A0A0KKH7_CUCSA|nr:hypothetical protein Csa_000524 [Cucumis sativus]